MPFEVPQNPLQAGDHGAPFKQGGQAHMPVGPAHERERSRHAADGDFLKLESKRLEHRFGIRDYVFGDGVDSTKIGACFELEQLLLEARPRD